MASYGTMQRPSTTATSTLPTTTRPHESEDSAGKRRGDQFKLLCAFNIPATPEVAAVRIIQNLGVFGLYYALFIWTILFITLVPERKVSLIFMVGMTAAACLYLVLLRVVPNSIVLQKNVERRFVLALLAIATMVELILTSAAIHLFVTLGCAIPIILVHAVFRVRDDVFVEEEASAAGELVPLRTTSDPKLSDVV